MIKTQDFPLDPKLPGRTELAVSVRIRVEEIVGRPKGDVPSYLPGKNPFVHEFADKYKIPIEAALGGAATMYPEYRLKIKPTPSATGDAICPHLCNPSWGLFPKARPR